VALPQIVKPPYVTEPSAYHVNVCPCVIITLLGPLLPLYRVPPMVM
jgi:hypothetical protein